MMLVGMVPCSQQREWHVPAGLIQMKPSVNPCKTAPTSLLAPRSLAPMATEGI